MQITQVWTSLNTSSALPMCLKIVHDIHSKWRNDDSSKMKIYFCFKSNLWWCEMKGTVADAGAMKRLRCFNHAFNAWKSQTDKCSLTGKVRSNKFGYGPSCPISVILSFYKHNSLSLGPIRAFISFRLWAPWSYTCFLEILGLTPIYFLKIVRNLQIWKRFDILYFRK